MESWISFLSLATETLVIMSVLNFRFETELPLALNHILKTFGHNAARFLKPSLGATVWKSLETQSKLPNGNKNQLPDPAEQTWTSKGDVIIKNLNPVQPEGKPTLNQHFFPRAEVSLAAQLLEAFFEHEDYEYKLLSRGELYFRPKGTHTFRTGPIVPKDPGCLFIVKLDGTGSNVVAFCFEPTSRALGEVNGRAEFLPVQTSIASSQEAHGLAYAQGQGCVFDWVYGNQPFSQYSWDYNLRYDVGWIHSIPATEELFAFNDELLVECCPTSASLQTPLRHSLEGLHSVASFPSPDMLGKIQGGCAHNEFTGANNQLTDKTQPSSSFVVPTLPVPLAPSPQTEDSISTNSPPTRKSVLRRTCNICNRVLRRPSALALSSAMSATIALQILQISSDTNRPGIRAHSAVENSV
ncbi:hypothetical protein B0J17DRAFT_628667 [Rhizoctonia solani]|nr:hypothetical protein B0J17DRAFT_628667 [Rhizoctonia solani]